ncbi:MAG: hypothetical protein GXP49_05855 [Deltaproteobacteria bacterium]|nr:hypothetical protein [Deltaproteobacteria bacterium]
MKYSISILLALIGLLFPLEPSAAGPGMKNMPRLSTLLEKGVVVVIETNKNNKFKSATAYIPVDAPAQKVFDTILDFSGYPSFMPTCIKADVLSKTQDQAVVKYELEVPGLNTKYTVQYRIDSEHLAIYAKWKAGDLEGSRWTWRLVPLEKNRTLVEYKGTTKNFSSFAASLEDKRQTLTVGINVTSVVASVRAVKARAEGGSKHQK